MSNANARASVSARREAVQWARAIICAGQRGGLTLPSTVLCLAQARRTPFRRLGRERAYHLHARRMGLGY